LQSIRFAELARSEEGCEQEDVTAAIKNAGKKFLIAYSLDGLIIF